MIAERFVDIGGAMGRRALRRKELGDWKVVELRALARHLGLRPGARRKAEIIDMIMEMEKKAPAGKAEIRASHIKACAPPVKRGAVSPVSVVLHPLGPQASKGPNTGIEPEGGASPQRELMPFLRKRRSGPALKGPAPASERSAALAGQDKEPVDTPLGETPRSGQGMVGAVAVEPDTMFVYWELPPEAGGGPVLLRLYDVTGEDFPGGGSTRFLDIGVKERIGSSYIDVSPEGEYVVDLGTKGEGGFVAAKRSVRVSMPSRGPQEGESDLPEEYFHLLPGDYGSE
jgi:hypothetical protein